ncbi:MAG: acetamidase/formamidase family protein [Christensenellales bacterium]
MSITISSSHSVITMSPNNAPAAKAKPGDTVCFETLNCYSERIKTEEDKMSLVPWECINPATGPLYVEGAEVGDVLKVEILKIELAEYGVMAVGPNFGVLGDVLKEERTRILPIKDGKVQFNGKLSLPVQPMIGVIGTAPKDADIPTGTPGTHGSNMDCKLIGEGTTLYLPVNTEGALLAMGDIHAVMGDGEIIICGVEASGRITVRVDVVKGFNAHLPMLLTKDRIVMLSSAKTLDEASFDVTHKFHEFLCKFLGMELHEAGMLLSAACDLRICQIVDPLYTVRMELPLWIAKEYGFEMP